MVKKTTSIKVDPILWKKVKKHCIDIDTDISKFIEQILIKELNKKQDSKKK